MGKGRHAAKKEKNVSCMTKTAKLELHELDLFTNNNN